MTTPPIAQHARRFHPLTHFFLTLDFPTLFRSSVRCHNCSPTFGVFQWPSPTPHLTTQQNKTSSYCSYNFPFLTLFLFTTPQHLHKSSPLITEYSQLCCAYRHRSQQFVSQLAKKGSISIRNPQSTHCNSARNPFVDRETGGGDEPTVSATVQ